MSVAPLVTIGVPNYNYAHFIVSTLESVAQQDYANIELVIIDDCSTDNSIGVIETWIENYSGNIRPTFIKNNINQGLTANCNLILKNASGKYIQFLDADDLILPGKIKTQVAQMEVLKTAAFIYSDVFVIDEKDEIIENSYLNRIGYNKSIMPSGEIQEQLFDFNFIPLPSVLVRTAYIHEASGFDETLGVQDYYLWLKITEKHKVIYMPESTAMYRVHPHSMSNSRSTNPKSVDSILTINYRYYKNANELIRKKIKRTVHNSAAHLYKLKYPTAKKWLKVDFLLNPGIKTALYYLGIKLGVPYLFFEKMKSKF